MAWQWLTVVLLWWNFLCSLFWEVTHVMWHNEIAIHHAIALLPLLASLEYLFTHFSSFSHSFLFSFHPHFTALLGAVSVFVARYKLLLLPGLAILAYVAYSIHTSPATSSHDFLSPFLIGTGLIIMYQASSGSWSHSEVVESADGTSEVTTSVNWLLYWVGETMVIFMFTYNSLLPTQQQNILIKMAVAIFALLVALWFRGRFWNYIIVIGLELFLALFIAVSFPIFEMILEAILNDKLKKVGDKVRAQHAYMERYYQQQAAKKKQKD